MKLRVHFIVYILICLTLVGCTTDSESAVHYKMNKNATALERFINDELTAKNNLIRTNITNRKKEYLSESMGIWLQYLVSSNQKGNFEIAEQAMKEKLLLSNNLVAWQLKNNKLGTTNAFIDDARIIEALVSASEKWGNPKYAQLANKIAIANRKYSTNDGIFVDFASTDSSNKAKSIMISYLMPNELTAIRKVDENAQEIVENSLEILKNATTDKNGYYAKNYNIQSSSYEFDKDVHMIDQFLTAINKVKIGQDTTAFKKNIKTLLKRDGHIFGQYNRKTNNATVNFESPAVYSYAARYFQELGDKTTANKMINLLKAMQQSDKNQPYYGGFINPKSKETHSFDNLLPLVLIEGSKST